MRAVWIDEHGGPEVLAVREAPDPSPEQGQVVIEVECVALGFVDTLIRAGTAPGGASRQLPFVPGRAAGGRVIQIGPDTDRAWIGKRVLARTGESALAQFVVAPAVELIVIPDALTIETATALFPDGNTALGLLEIAEVREGEWVLIEAAAGGLGVLLTQLARAIGARVIGASRGPSKAALLRELGALAVDYSDAGWIETVRQMTGHGADVIFDSVGGTIGTAALGALAPGGRFSIHGAASGRFTSVAATHLAIQGQSLIGIGQLASLGHDLKRRSETVLSLAQRGLVRAVIGQTFPLDAIAQAHRAIEARSTIGKTLVLLHPAQA